MPTSPKNTDLIVVILDQVNVSVCNTAPVLAALREKLLGLGQVRKFSGRVTFVFDGYDSQSAELYENPVVRAFVARLTQQFPYWLHFASKDDDTLFVLVMCLMGPEGVVVERGRGGTVRLQLDTGKFSDIVLDLFRGMNSLYAEYGLGEDENRAMTKQVERWLGRVTGA
jgi:hypothetical protein